MPVTPDSLDMVLRLLAALGAGALIGYERSFRGRPAGFRTHALVCMASSVLMLITVYETHWVRTAAESIRLDPTRMAQGIMTGIGFLGAGVIVKEGLTIRGLTTAASIWITAAVGVLAGIGLYFPLAVAVALILGVLSVFRWIEDWMPTHSFYLLNVRLNHGEGVDEARLRSLIEDHGFSISNFSYGLDSGRVQRHTMILRTVDRKSAARLSSALVESGAVLEFKLSPTGD